jgi:hypothetical protein
MTYLRYAPRADDVVGYVDESMGPLCPDCAPLAAHDAPIFRSDETDAPMHCDACRVLLPIRLTPDGRAYVAEAIADGRGDQDVLQAWADAYSITAGDVLALELPHVWRRSTFGTNVLCDACNLLPLDDDDVDTFCPGRSRWIIGA